MQLRLFRILLFAFASVLAIDALWLLLPELTRPKQPASFPFASAAVPVVFRDSEPSRAAMAARLGVLRGDLWADDAILLASELGNDFYEAHAAASDKFGAVRDAAERALRYAPHDARVWLILAAGADGIDQTDSRLPGLLKMSYYAAPNDADLMPLRLLMAVRSEAITDIDLQVLVAAELRTIMQNRPDLKPAIVAAYQAAQAPGKKFTRDALQNLDPVFAATLGTGDGDR